jgi:outer membrane protein assembly factor BamB
VRRLVFAVAAWAALAVRAAAAGDAGVADEPPWRWDEAQAAGARAEVAGSDGDRFMFTATPWHARLARLGARGRKRWRYPVPGSAPDGAALALGADTLFAALYDGGAPGCQVIALDARTGKLRWTTTLLGIGRMAHSKYSNQVQLELRDGRLVIYGKESAGRYIEVLSADDGHTVNNRMLPR